MNYKLILTARAKQDRDRAYDWFNANYSAEFAARWYQGISDTVESIVQNPMHGHKAEENDRFPFELYEWLYGKRRNKHRILYTIENNIVFILSIRHSSQRDLASDDL
jgi:plasmid stabilization system protein ParE